MISCCFLIISLLYTIQQSYFFMQTVNIVKTSRDVIQVSPAYKLTYKELYFGIYFLDNNNNKVNIAELPYLKIQLLSKSSDGNVKDLGLGPCDLNRFHSTQVFTSLSSEEQKSILASYLCPLKNFAADFNNAFLGKNNKYPSRNKFKIIRYKI